jgi:hypothetical protein
MNGPTLIATTISPAAAPYARCSRFLRQILPFVIALPLATAGCVNFNSSLNYTSDEAQTSPEVPALVEIGLGVPEETLAEVDVELTERGKPWYELTREARVARQAGDYEAAREALSKASAQLASRPADNVQRRTVHSATARLAMLLATSEQSEKANEIAEDVLAEAEADPLVGGPATVELAYYLAQKRTLAAKESGLPESQLPLLRIALLVSEHEAASNERLTLAYDTSQVASREGDYDLARRAIDLAVLDAKTLDPLGLSQLATLKIAKMRIALAQGDLATAEATGAAANRLLDEFDAPAEDRAIGEATIARVIAERGDTERARAIALSARSRLGGDPPAGNHGTRIDLGELARLERAAGDLDAARRLYAEALDLPGVDLDLDIDLVEELTQELAALNEGERADVIPADADATIEPTP